MHFLVVDFGGTLVKYSVMDQEGNFLESGEEKAPLGSREEFLSFLEGLVKRFSSWKVEGLALSLPGVIDTKACFVRTAGAYLPLYGMDLKKELEGRISIPFTVENDAKCGALSEVWLGNLKDNQDGVVIILGTGVGGGIIKDRRLHKGAGFQAGELSLFLLGEGTGFDSLAVTRCSVSALRFEACLRLGIDGERQSSYELLSQVRDCSQTLTELNDKEEYKNGLDGHQFFALLEEGNEVVQGLYEDFIGNLAKLCWNIQIFYGPEKILFGGGVTRQERLLKDIRSALQRIEETYVRLMEFPFVIERCRFGNEANQVGALYHHLQSRGLL